MLEQISREFIQRHRLLEKGDRLVVAVSGGPDSLALIHFLHALRDELDVEVACAHVDHMFRGRESYEDLLFVEGFCKERDIPFFGERINIPEMMATEKGSLQEMARKARYGYLRQVMDRYGGNKLALGHHGDDQVETILMKWTRGAGAKGRAGIPFKRPFSAGEIIRPFLPVTKEEILDYCKRERLFPRIDPSNSKDTYTRNRFRSRVLPFLKEENPHVHRNFQQFSEESLEDEEFLEELTRVKLNKVWKVEEDFSTLDIKRFLQMAQPLQRRAINLILNYLYKLKPASLSSIHIYDVLRLLKGENPNAQLDLPSGLKVTKAYQTCYFHFGNLSGGPYYFELGIHSSIILPNGIRISLMPSRGYVQDDGGETIHLNRDGVTLPLIVRTREAGDRMKVKGMEGSKKLKTLFIDEKIPLHLRDRWPVVTDYEGRILWVPGLRKSVYDTGEGREDSLVLQVKSNHLLGGS